MSTRGLRVKSKLAPFIRFGFNRSTAAPQHGRTKLSQHRKTAAPQHQVTAAPQHQIPSSGLPAHWNFCLHFSEFSVK
jgi:hypothetical protein